MKNCEQNQMMLSELYDDGTDIKQNDELQSHLHSCADCKEFQVDLQNQSIQLQNLPNIDFQNEQEETILKKIWKTKISIPLPAAAAVFVIVTGLYWLNGSIEQVEPQIIEVEKQQTEYQNVQFVKFSPQSAVLVESNDN